ncbi:MAG: hypothetical protein M0R66_02695 [Candidatus Omnitrophica bacterium]|jgi:hypothetical protein|nr:hypothetical protein [Sphaerochaeta sp.]MCK9603249.1 hypothetical protein [Candidatus Omnitrophota bacterium]
MAELHIPLDKWFETEVKKLDTRIEQVADEVASEGEAMVKESIGTRGTGKTWARTYYKRGTARSGSYPGRVWTGEMQGDIESEVASTPEAIVASYGWTNNYEDYYGLQEGGFDHEVTGEHIEGMFAMADAADYTEHSVDQKIGRALREF